MTFLKSTIFASILALPLAFAACDANATVITVAGKSEGSFSSVSGCVGTNCRVTAGSDGANTVLEWGYTNPTTLWGWTITPGSPGSTLVAKDRSWDATVNAEDVILAELVWTNLATKSSITPDSFSVNYTLDINFTKPNVTKDSEAFSLSIFNTENNGGDTLKGLTMTDLGNLSFMLQGVLMSDLKYELAKGSAGSFINNNWANPEGGVSTMYITADFKAPAIKPVENNVRPVPEPASLALIGAGLFGIGALRRRKRA